MQSEKNFWYRFTPGGIDWAVIEETPSAGAQARVAESGAADSHCLAFDSLESAVGGLMDAGFDLLSQDPLLARVFSPPKGLTTQV